MRTAFAVALALLALASGVHGAAHSQCQDGAAVTNPKIEGCPAMVSGSFTPSMCKDEAKPAGSNSSTAATVDSKFAAYLSGWKANVAAPGVWYGSYCGDKAGEVAVKAGVDSGWQCQSLYVKVRNDYACKAAWNCSVSPNDDIEACESVSAMLTAVCDLTADKIKSKVAKRKTDGYCKNKADGGEEFSLPLNALKCYKSCTGSGCESKDGTTTDTATACPADVSSPVCYSATFDGTSIKGCSEAKSQCSAVKDRGGTCTECTTSLCNTGAAAGLHAGAWTAVLASAVVLVSVHF